MELTVKKYKQTEVGLIPEDWKIKCISDFSSPVRGGSPRPAGSPLYFNGNFIPWLTVASLTNIPDSQLFVNETKSFLTEAGSSQSRKLDKGTLIIANSGATLGVAKLLGITCCANDGVAALQSIRKNIYPQYLVYFINSITKKLREDIATGNGQPNLNTELIGKLIIPLPPTLTEQKGIAQVLSDTDALIQALEQKIAKKKDIKKGVMQKLLTPKENWIESKVSSVGQPYGGMSGKTKADFSNGNAHYVPFMNVMSNPIIDTGYLDSVNIKKGETQNKILKGDLLFNGSSETPEEVGFCSTLLEQMDNLYLNSFCFGFRIHNTKQYDSLFLAYFFRSSLGRNFFYSLAQGATRYNLSKTNFLKSTLTLPVYEDQVQIASIVREIDSEIDNLEQKLSKYQLVKQGILQQLLTGKIRLV